MLAEALRRDDTGERVAQMQRRLNLAGYSVLVDGVFGPHTQAAVAAFLREHGLAGNGALVSPRALALLEFEAQTPSPRPRVYAPAAPGVAVRGQPPERATQLGTARHADLFARVICSRRTATPLSIGLFGDFGVGKSFFLSRLQERIDWRCRALARAAAMHDRNDRQDPVAELHGRWHARIAQVEFNAWHFAEPNLWASLVTRVFDELASIVNPEESIEDTRARLLAKVAEGQQQRELASTRLATAEAALVDALAEQQQRQAELEELYEQLGVVEAAAPVTEGASLEVASPWDALVITLRWIWSRGRWTRIGVIAGLVVLVAAIVLAILWALGVIDLHPAITVVTGLLGVVTSWTTIAATWWKKIKPKIAKAKKALADVKEARDKATQFVAEAAQDLVDPHTRAVASAKKRFEAAQIRREQARSASEQAQAALADARRSLRDLEAGRRFYAFVNDRDRSDDYRQHLGLVSMIREDFAQLDRILRQVEREGPSPSDAPAISRIVLYIDDLDRCEPERVVEVLHAINLLLATPLFVVVLAGDVRWLERSLDLHYERLLDSPTPTPSEERPSARRFLEKVVQIPFALPPMDRDGFASLVDQATAAATGPSNATTAQPPPPSEPDDEAAEQDTQPVVPAPTKAEAEAVAEDPRLSLTEDEVAFAKELHAVLQTPRHAEAMLVTYRMLRASLPEERLERYLKDHDYRAVLSLLALAIGRGPTARASFDAIRHTEAGTLGQSLQITGTDWPASVVELSVERLRPWLDPVARFSFFVHTRAARP